MGRRVFELPNPVRRPSLDSVVREVRSDTNCIKTMKIPITFFAPAERQPVEVVHRQARRFKKSPVARTLAKAGLNYLFLLNANRQIVMVSENVLDLVTDKTMDQIVGLRPGEALGCIHAYECEGGCGTSRFCRDCAAVKVILSALAGTRDMAECQMTRVVKGRETALILQMLATPLAQNGDTYTLLTVAHLSPSPRSQ